MNANEELEGLLVLVHPNLKNDPAGRKNQVGVILAADLAHDNITVNFSDGHQALFSSDALLVLRNIGEVQHFADLDATLLPYYDYYDLLEAISFAKSPLIEYQRQAIALSSKNPTVLEYMMQSLRSELGLKSEYGMTR